MLSLKPEINVKARIAAFIALGWTIAMIVVFARNAKKQNEYDDPYVMVCAALSGLSAFYVIVAGYIHDDAHDNALVWGIEIFLQCITFILSLICFIIKCKRPGVTEPCINYADGTTAIYLMVTIHVVVVFILVGMAILYFMCKSINANDCKRSSVKWPTCGGSNKETVEAATTELSV